MRMFVEMVPALACVLFYPNMATAESRSYALPEEKAAFRAALGMEAAQNNCMSCHSADYVSTQPPQLGPKFWEGVVTKMVKTYHAPIPETDAKAIVEYLSRMY